MKKQFIVNYCYNKGRFLRKKDLMNIKIITTGGTIDKIYFDQKSDFQVGEPSISEILKEANVTFSYSIMPVLRKDSMDMTHEDRMLIYSKVKSSVQRHIVITHGTDTMIDTARMLQKINAKVIVLTGAMQPAKFRFTDAVFNIGCAVTAVQILPEGVYIAMNGQIFNSGNVRKNQKLNRFEPISPNIPICC
jgi:L-asparaginase